MPSWTPDISLSRREAIGRAARAIVRLAVIPDLRVEAHRQHGIVAAVTVYGDQEAAAAVAALENMLVTHALMTPEQIEADTVAHRLARSLR